VTNAAEVHKAASQTKDPDPPPLVMDPTAMLLQDGGVAYVESSAFFTATNSSFTKNTARNNVQNSVFFARTRSVDHLSYSKPRLAITYWTWLF